jgi:putative component of membrane protein insertase Oxa1/YidC/SpoIIIJ protein YidD
MVDAINEWGVLRGVWMGIKRIGRCHPWSKHDTIDPVPPNRSKKVKKAP